MENADRNLEIFKARNGILNEENKDEATNDAEGGGSWVYNPYFVCHKCGKEFTMPTNLKDYEERLNYQKKVLEKHAAECPGETPEFLTQKLEQALAEEKEQGGQAVRRALRIVAKLAQKGSADELATLLKELTEE